jgi:hypothetical protein
MRAPRTAVTAALWLAALGADTLRAEVVRDVLRAEAKPVIDGRADEADWTRAPWRPLRHTLVGEPPQDTADFSGRYRLLWREDALYLLAEIRDDVLVDAEPDPLRNYWADDALEILVDEDASGGPHQTDHGAFAYHVALDGRVVDLGEDGQPMLLDGHVQSAWRRASEAPHALIWEARILLYPDPAALTAGAEWQPRSLQAGERLGFALAWCDSDAPGQRRRLIADVDVAPVDGDRNRLYRDASVFGRIRLLP